MPLSRGSDSKGPFYRWGSRGKKFHYLPSNQASRKRAKNNALNDRKRVEYYKNRSSL